MKIKNISFRVGYGGRGVKVEAETDKLKMLVDLEEIEKIIREKVKRKEYCITKTNNQKFPRLEFVTYN